jgi:hypothetical protein
MLPQTARYWESVTSITGYSTISGIQVERLGFPVAGWPGKSDIDDPML